MKTIVGLGNPGSDYESTRHNAGRMAVEYFAEKNDFSDWEESKKYLSLASEGKIKKSSFAKASDDGEKALLLLPETFMNNSGRAIKLLQARNLIVVHDDIDLPFGKFKISFGRGSGGHKGIESIIRALKTKDFWRIRIGISPNKKPNHKEMPSFLTSDFSKPELQKLQPVFKKILEALAKIITSY